MASYDYITRSGSIIPDTASVQADVEAEYRTIFGDDLITDPETPEGSLITAEVTSRQSVLRNNANIANQINPTLAGGTFFDAIYALTDGQRVVRSRSTVDLVCSGVSQTVIPAGSRAEDSQGVEWFLVDSTTIEASGNVTAQFQSQEFGEISASPNTITSIVDSVLGWETVNNPLQATIGRNTQSDSEAKRDRKNELALLGSGTSLAVQSRLSSIPSVRSFAFRENIEDTTEDIDGVTLVPHSVWVAVEGGSDNDVATALLAAKSGGANWNGSTTVNITDPSSGQSIGVSFDRPTAVPILVRVTVRASSGTSPTENVQQAVLDYANGLVAGEEGFIVGADVSPFEIGSAVNTQVTGTFVQLVEVALNVQNPTFVTTTLDIDINELATVIESDVSVILI